MEADFDKNKTRLEKRIDSAISILSHTYPEQKMDAMGDYVKILVMLKSSNDWRVAPIRNLLNRLYIYPNREEHNELLTEVHDLKEELHEYRINATLSQRKIKANLGADPESPANKRIILLLGLLLLLVIGIK